MIIRCPKCRTGYSVSNDQIHETGRTVRCTQCSHVWHQEKVDNFMSPKAITGQAPLAPEVPTLKKQPEAKKGISLSKLHISLISATASLMIVFFVVWAVVGAIPFSDKFMVSLGFGQKSEETASATGLIIPKESVERTLENGEPIVMVYRGKIKNTNQVAVNIPKIIITLHDDKGVEIDRWPAYPEKKHLEAGEETSWICRFFNPDLDNVFEHRILFK